MLLAARAPASSQPAAPGHRPSSGYAVTRRHHGLGKICNGPQRGASQLRQPVPRVLRAHLLPMCGDGLHALALGRTEAVTSPARVGEPAQSAASSRPSILEEGSDGMLLHGLSGQPLLHHSQCPDAATGREQKEKKVPKLVRRTSTRPIRCTHCSACMKVPPTPMGCKYIKYSWAVEEVAARARFGYLRTLPG